MQSSFDQKKNCILKKIDQTNENNPDSSPKGTIDLLCRPLIDLINLNKNMVTLSSCSGRVSVFVEGKKNNSNDNIKISAKGNDNSWLFVTHTIEGLNDWYENKKIVFLENENFLSLTDINTRYILFKFEPLILHVKCRNIEQAKLMYCTALECGLRESGIGSNNVVFIKSSMKLDIPVGFFRETDRYLFFVSKNYLKKITELSIDRFKVNFKLIDKLYNAIKKINQNKI